MNTPPTTTGAKGLLVLDFDYTIMNVDTDHEVAKLAKDGQIPIEYNKYYVNAWTDYIQAVFEYLYKEGIREDDYYKCVRQLPFAPGMDRLIRMTGSSGKYEIVIVSDANSYFIDSILKHHELTQFVTKIFTNPAHFDATGCLRIAYYHTQTECTLSEKNMCKGKILNDYVKQRRDEGVHFERVIYVGDGKNDYCPVVRSLQKQDHVFARKGYTLERLIKQNPDKVKCQVHIWSSGDEIADSLELGMTKVDGHSSQTG